MKIFEHHRFFTFFLIGISLLFSFSCNKKEKEKDKNLRYLNMLDSIVSAKPEAVLDSLKKIDVHTLSKYDRAYYDLLTVIASDKSFIDFTSDSAINEIVSTLSHYRIHHPRQYARALMYQGLVRYRMGVIDNTAYQPIKDAVTIFESLTPPKSLQNLYLCYYYLGDLNFKNNNLQLSNFYFQQSLKTARIIGNRDNITLIYLNLFWNALRTRDFNQAKIYLDTLNQWKKVPAYKIDVSNANAVYYKNQKEYGKALQVEYELLSDKAIPEDKTVLAGIYYRMSEDYRQINKPDSALKYALLAEKNASDSTHYMNYYYYENIAKNAINLRLWKESARNYQIAYQLLTKSVNKQLDTKVLELEKKYDLSEARNKKLRAEKRSYVYLTLMSAVFAALIYLFFFHRQRLLHEKIAKKTIEQELIIQNHQLEQVKKDATIKRWINDLYQYVIERDKKLENLLYKLENNKLFRQDEKLMSLLGETMTEYNKEMKESSIKLLDEEMFGQFTGLNTEKASVLLDSEKLLLVLIICEMNNKQIASLTGSSAESIRKRRGLLLKKMEENSLFLDEKSFQSLKRE
ncbi:hypothetical protein TRIP_D440208 [uncultured Paludibacter sp.]|nr:hypothetical protein TRIP_D440208 [uncultured Paludibacter sp.]